MVAAGGVEPLNLPACVLWGPKDTVAVLPIGERLARTIPGARLELLEGLGHFPMLEDPRRTGAALAGWLDQFRLDQFK